MPWHHHKLQRNQHFSNFQPFNLSTFLLPRLEIKSCDRKQTSNTNPNAPCIGNIYLHFLQGGPLPVINWVLTPISSVTTPGKPVYFRPFIGVSLITQSYNDRLGAHLVLNVAVFSPHIFFIHTFGASGNDLRTNLGDFSQRWGPEKGSSTIFKPRSLPHPWRLTWNIIMEVWKIMFLSKRVICRFHVNLPGCIQYYYYTFNPCFF